MSLTRDARALRYRGNSHAALKARWNARRRV